MMIWLFDLKKNLNAISNNNLQFAAADQNPTDFKNPGVTFYKNYRINFDYYEYVIFVVFAL